ncbi:AMP-binding protein [Streptomyces europaeiscabiei]|uniref:AMP-binding protein n=1 Tax=Streptomyces TaxID=1883 RepID=UPI0039A52C65
MYARRIAVGLAALGAGAGGVVTVQLPARVETGGAYAAVLLCGGVLLPVSPEATAEEARLVLRLTGATALITSVWRAHDVLRTRGSEHAVPRLRLRVAVPGTSPAAAVPADAVDWFTLLNPRPVEPASRTDQDQVCLLAWTEGVGGTPRMRPAHPSLTAGRADTLATGPDGTSGSGAPQYVAARLRGGSRRTAAGDGSRKTHGLYGAPAGRPRCTWCTATG